MKFSLVDIPPQIFVSALVHQIINLLLRSLTSLEVTGFRAIINLKFNW